MTLPKPEKKSSSPSPIALFGKYTRRYSWHVVIILIVTALLMLAGGAAAILLGFPEYKETLMDAAQSLGGLGAVLGSVQAYWKQIRQKYALARLQHAKNHVVVCGLGEKGMRLVNSFVDAGRTVTVIETKKDHPESAGCWERGGGRHHRRCRRQGHSGGCQCSEGQPHSCSNRK